MYTTITVVIKRVISYKQVPPTYMKRDFAVTLIIIMLVNLTLKIMSKTRYCIRAGVGTVFVVHTHIFVFLYNTVIYIYIVYNT